MNILTDLSTRMDFIRMQKEDFLHLYFWYNSLDYDLSSDLFYKTLDKNLIELYQDIKKCPVEPARRLYKRELKRFIENKYTNKENLKQMLKLLK